MEICITNRRGRPLIYLLFHFHSGKLPVVLRELYKFLLVKVDPCIIELLIVTVKWHRKLRTQNNNGPSIRGREVTGLLTTAKKHEDSDICATERERINRGTNSEYRRLTVIESHRF